MTTAIIIPARLGSTRLPGKLLLDETGKPLIQHTWERACRVVGVDQVLIATDDQKIARCVTNFGGQAVMTRSNHTSGSSRIAQAAQSLNADIIVNLQGDEPEIDTQAVQDLIDLHRKAGVFASTLASPFSSALTTGPGSPDDPAAVKVVLSQANPNGVQHALYFSRAAIPHNRNQTEPSLALMHIGIYAYSALSLQKFANHSATPLELTEGLEQLRILEMGEKIAVLQTTTAMPGIDTRADYEAFLARMAS